MITLHSVTKSLGRGRRKTLALNQIDWTIPPGAQIAILSQKGGGKSTLLDILAGSAIPTAGWVERRALISPRVALTRYALRYMTPRHLIDQHARLYLTDRDALIAFVAEFASLRAELDMPIRHLTPHQRQALHLALLYGTPFDYYLFDNKITLGHGRIQQRVQAALKQRKERSGAILATGSIKAARAFGGAGGVLHRGQLMLFPTVQEAIQAHEYLLRHDPLPTIPYREESPEDEEYLE